MKREISNSDNVIDSRDVIARIDELESGLQSDWETDGERLQGEMGPTFDDWLVSQDSDDAQELKILRALQDEAEGYASDWRYGATLINESYFEDYARELADDIGATKKDQGWPYNHIDWEAAADELLGDYTEVSFDGTTYYVR